MKIKHAHIPNETYTRYRKQIMRNKSLGMSSGVPDYMIILPKKRLKTANIPISGADLLIWIEMKRPKGGVVSQTQKERLHELSQCDSRVFVCNGFVEARKTILSLIIG